MKPFKYNPPKPTPQDLAELSQLYNYRRALQLKIKDAKEEFSLQIEVIAKRRDLFIKNNYGEEYEGVQKRIRELKTKFRMDQKWELFKKANDII